MIIMVKEEKCIILDFLPSGYAGRRQAEPVAQAIGRNFTLLEVVPKDGVDLKPDQEVYIGDGPRPEIRFIKSQIEYAKLTNFAKSLIPQIVEKIVKEDEKRFVDFFNAAGTVTPRLHQIELLPGIGKKHVMDLLDERRKKPFESFAEMFQRVRLFPDPFKAVVKRIMMEIENDEKYYIFAPPKKRLLGAYA